MSEEAKKARAAMKAKAQRLGGADRPLEKVDSSSWTPPELLNADVKTGARPLTRRAYKSGGKVSGDAAKARADRPARKSGGSALTADSLINRNVKSANAEREGKKHIGGFKKGGRTGKDDGGSIYDDPSWKSKSPAIQRALDSIKETTQPAYLRKTLRENEDRRLADPEYQAYLKRKGLPATNKWADESKSLNEIYSGKKSRSGKCSGGGMKTRGKYATDGFVQKGINRLRDAVGLDSPDYAPKSTGKVSNPYKVSDEDRDALSAMSAKAADTRSNQEAQRKHGGRAKKFMGGPMMQPGGLLTGSALAGNMTGPSGMPAGAGMPGTSPAPIDPRLGIVSKNAMNFSGAQGSPYKKGGAVKHPDVAEDKALIKKMVKPSAMKRGEYGTGGGPSNRRQQYGGGYQAGPEAQIGRPQSGMMGESSSRPPQDLQRYDEPQSAGSGAKKGGRIKRMEGGKVFSGEGYPHKVPGADGGRTARASGGRTGKGKTNINIVIAAGKGQQPGMPPAGGLMPPPPPPAGGGRPVTVPPPPPGGAGAAPMPMPIPMPMPMGGAGAPTGAPPMPRKAGGRITKVAKSYKDMEAGAGSGEGRLQKTDIAKRTMHNKGGKVGHRNYRNYEDMDAGAGGGFGRLEKTEIARKGTGIQMA